jgi:reactive intermediate/imine deaminase
VKFETQEVFGMYIRQKFIMAVLILFAAPLLADSAEVDYYSSNPSMQLPFSDAVRVGHMLYLSGKIGNIPGTPNLVEGGIRGETRRALESIKASLEKYGSSMGEVVKCTVFLADIAEWGAMNEVYMEFFHTNPPARSALGTSGLALDARVEIECFATVK